jgi:hypothetical protein
MTRLRRAFHLFTAGVLIAGLVSACGSSGTTPTNIAQRKARATEKGESHWTTTVSGMSGVSSGKWRLDFNPRSKLVILTTPANKPFSTGLLESGNRVKFPVVKACSGQSKASTGLYGYTMSSTQLTFTKQSDSCGARATILTKQPWAKQ